MNKRNIKLLICLAITTSISAGLIACNNQTSASRDSSINYTVTGEAPEEMDMLSMENRPTAPHWFPNQLLKWNPGEDENIEYNKSVVPLKERVSKDKLKPINKTQNKDMNVVAISIMNASTSGNPSQGTNKFSSNTFTYWQYIDKLVYWGGSSGEGIIVPPSADVTDSAHKNGVPVLGTVFFPTTTHGGKLEWLNEFLKKDKDGNFPMVDKLIEVAKTLNFDGWFINQETEGTDKKPLTKEHAVLMQEFIKQFKSKAKDSLEIMWYDSMTEDGKMDWQNALTDKNDYFLVDGNKESVSDSMFLNFWWTENELASKKLLESSNKKAKDLNINPYDLYAGIDVQANGTNTPIKWDLFEGKGNAPFTSLGLYCPSWTYFSSSSIDEFQDKESRLWVNEFKDPSKDTKVSKDEWHGVSKYAIEKTVVNSLPFNTNFNVGNGYNFFIDGEKVSALDWNNRSLADVMPTYRWIIENEGSNSLKGSIDYSNAYYGGNSIKFMGKVEENKSSTIKLFSSDLKLEKGTKFTSALRADGESSVSLVLGFDDGSFETIDGDKTINKDWSTISFDVSKYKDKTVSSISYKVTPKASSNNFTFNIGNISITSSKSFGKVNVSNLKVDNSKFEEENMFSGVRLSYDVDSPENLSHFEIYKINDDKSKSFLGATLKNKFYVDSLKRDENSNSTEFEVVPINKDFKAFKSSTVKMEWPDNNIPRADFKVSKTIVAPSEAVEFKNLSSKVSKDFEWTFEGADTEKSTDENPIVSYKKEGTYTVSLKAKNGTHEDTKVMEKVITVTKNAKNYSNISKGKDVTASSFVNPNEAAKYALDGKLDTKWCAVGTPPHNITVDLGKSMTVSEVRMSHAEAGNESPDMNTSDYTIEVSEDGKKFEEVASIRKNKEKISSDTFKPTKARYVRVNVSKPTQGSDSAVRIYELEVFGIK